MALLQRCALPRCAQATTAGPTLARRKRGKRQAGGTSLPREFSHARALKVRENRIRCNSLENRPSSVAAQPFSSQNKRCVSSPKADATLLKPDFRALSEEMPRPTHGRCYQGAGNTVRPTISAASGEAPESDGLDVIPDWVHRERDEAPPSDATRDDFPTE